MNALHLRLTVALLAASLAAACGGGGSSPAPHAPAAAATASPAGRIASGATLTIKIPRKKSTSASAAKRGASARRSPKFVPASTLGMQLTITSGSVTQTYFYDLGTSSVNCDQTGMVNFEQNCTVSLATLGLSETVTALLVNEEPNNLNTTTGMGTAFPSDSAVLARGTTTVSLTPGEVTNISLGLDPIVGLLFDCGCLSTVNFAEDNGTTPPRLVVTYGSVQQTTVNIGPKDASGFEIAPLENPDGSLTGQPLVDVNGSPEPVTIVSNSTHVGVYPEPGVATPTPAPVYTQAATIHDSSYTNDASILIDIHYDGTSTASSTIVVANNLSAALPVFLGPPVGNPQPANYAASLTYEIAPVALLPATVSVATSGTTVLTATDPGAGSGFTENSVSCLDASTNILGTATVSVPFASGQAQYTFVAGATPGTCTFHLTDDATSVVTNTETVTIN